MEDGTEKKDDPGSLMELKRNFDPLPSRTDLKQNQKHIQDTQNQND